MAKSTFILFAVASVLVCLATAQPTAFNSQVLSTTNDDCLAPSNGSSVVSSLLSGYSNFAGIASISDLASAASSMLYTLKNQFGFYSGHVTAAYYGFADGSFYMIRPCALPENIILKTNGVSYCAGTPYILSVRNNATLYSDNVRHIYALAADGTLGANLVNETSPYDPTVRFWYQNTNSWVSIISASTFGVSLTYSQAVSSATGVIVAIDRSYSEPCTACIISTQGTLNAYIVRSYASTFTYGLAVPLANVVAPSCPSSDYSLIPTVPSTAASISVPIGVFMAVIMMMIAFF